MCFVCAAPSPRTAVLACRRSMAATSFPACLVGRLARPGNPLSQPTHPVPLHAAPSCSRCPPLAGFPAHVTPAAHTHARARARTHAHANMHAHALHTCIHALHTVHTHARTHCTHAHALHSALTHALHICTRALHTCTHEHTAHVLALHTCTRARALHAHTAHTHGAQATLVPTAQRWHQKSAPRRPCSPASPSPLGCSQTALQTGPGTRLGGVTSRLPCACQLQPAWASAKASSRRVLPGSSRLRGPPQGCCGPALAGGGAQAPGGHRDLVTWCMRPGRHCLVTSATGRPFPGASRCFCGLGGHFVAGEGHLVRDTEPNPPQVG